MNDADVVPKSGEAPVAPEIDVEPVQATGFEPQWYVIIHNDDVTPFEYVIRILLVLFLLSEEIAEHVAHTAHNEGQAVVVVRPRDEAERLVKVAGARARLDGYPPGVQHGAGARMSSLAHGGPREPDWVHGHSHDPNPDPPAGDGSIRLLLPGGDERHLSVGFLRTLVQTSIPDCFIVSTGHGTSGPFSFEGVTLLDLLGEVLPASAPWRHIDVVSGDGFGTRLHPEDLLEAPPGRPVLLALTLDGAPLLRGAGLVRLVVPAETDDALKQVKWVERIDVSGAWGGAGPFGIARGGESLGTHAAEDRLGRDMSPAVR